MSTAIPQFVYDQDCVFCQQFVRRVERHCSSRVTFIGSCDYKGVGSEWTSTSSILVFQSPLHIYVGSEGIGQLFKLADSAKLRVAGKLILMPWLSRISTFVYRWIADRRHWFRSGCSTTSDVCALRPK